jgi:hypothetical protein
MSGPRIIDTDTHVIEAPDDLTRFGAAVGIVSLD